MTYEEAQGKLNEEAVRQQAQKLVAELRAKGECIPVTKLIQVHMVFDGPNTTGWVHTHGLWSIFGLPDLEIRDVRPVFLMVSAAQMLNTIANYMVNQAERPIEPGESMQYDPMTFLRFVKSVPIHPDDAQENEGHFKNPRLQVVPKADVPAKCSFHEVA